MRIILKNLVENTDAMVDFLMVLCHANFLILGQYLYLEDERQYFDFAGFGYGFVLVSN
jgi:hypothetical protein